MLAETWTDNLDDANHAPGWIWRGLLAPGQITLMTGLWKTGKTTLLSLERARKLGLGPDICFFCRPFIGRPSRAQFDDMIAQLLEMRSRRGVNLAVFDPLTCFMPAHTENSSDEALAAMGAMRRLADAGMAVLLPHHPAKGNPGVGQAARGTGALSAFAD